MLAPHALRGQVVQARDVAEIIQREDVARDAQLVLELAAGGALDACECAVT